MANGLCTSCQGLQRTIDKWRKRDEQDRHRADAAEAEVDRLRAESAQAWAINRVVKGTNERLADEVDRLRADAMAKAHRVGELAREVDRLRAEVDALADLIEWVRDAPHRDSCDKWGGSGRTSCTCGRDALDALDACRGE